MNNGIALKTVTTPSGETVMLRPHVLPVLILATGLSWAPLAALAQSPANPPQHVPLQKTIGESSTSTTEIEPSFIVLTARGASLQGGKLTLAGVSPNAVIFADRPVRAAAHALTNDLLQEWSPSNNSDESFAKDPPNATVSAFSKDGSKIRDAVVVLKTPKLEGDRLTFDVDVLEGDITGADGAASIFIDRFGYAYHGGSFAHAGPRGVTVGHYGGAAAVGHRPYVANGAWYRGTGYGAAAVGGAALGAAAAGAAYGAAACGYYPYPPCY
jgi:hypothetical protein